MLKVLYAVVDKDGNFSRRTSNAGGTIRIYVNRKFAERTATRDGDSVVELVWDSEREPLFIRGKKLEGE